MRTWKWMAQLVAAGVLAGCAVAPAGLDDGTDQTGAQSEALTPRALPTTGSGARPPAKGGGTAEPMECTPDGTFCGCYGVDDCVHMMVMVCGPHVECAGEGEHTRCVCEVAKQ
jgi:hypothetical protein